MTSGAPIGESGCEPARELVNLHRDLMRPVTADHGGRGTIWAHRMFDRAQAPADVAFIDLVVVPPGTSIGLHRHGDNEETYVILSGHATMTRDGTTFPVGPGDVVLNRPFGVHGLENDGDTDLHLMVFEIGPLHAEPS